MIVQLLDLIATFTVRGLCALLEALPLPLARRLLEVLVRFSTRFLVPRYRSIAQKNFAIAFPELADGDREQLLDDCHRSLARLLVDVARMPSLSREWCHAHVRADTFPELLALKEANPGRGILLISGHLGSFELLGNVIGLLCFPISVVARSFALPRLNAWWNRGREKFGNRVIGRAGAFPEVVADLKRGRSVGVLFDQNVKRAHAVFVPWFNRPAATTKMVALAAIRTEAPIFVVGMRGLAGDQYEVWGTTCDCRDVYQSDRALDEKILEITTRISQIYEGYIRKAPGEWFWFHRRWKTRPEGEAETVYATQS